MLKVEYLTYARVAQGVPRQDLSLEPTEELNAFLGAHIAGLKEVQRKRGLPPGRFMDDGARKLFRVLFDAPAEEFLSAAETLAARLIDKMNRSTAAGLLVCLRARSDEDGEVVAGALKLEVVSNDGAILEKLPTGADRLAAVKNVMERPGNLKKGALMSSHLNDDQVIICDLLAHQAAYFPKALGIKSFAPPREATLEFVSAVEQAAPHAMRDVVERLPALELGSVEAVLEDLGDVLDARERQEIQSTMERRSTPIRFLDPTAPVRQIIEAGGIKVSGPFADMAEHVRIEQLAGGRWRVLIDVDQSPKTTYK